MCATDMETTLLIFIPETILICATEKLFWKKSRESSIVTQLNITPSMILNPLKDIANNNLDVWHD